MTLGHDPLVLGQHYFVSNSTDPTAISPVWDFTSGAEKGNTQAFVLAAEVGDIPAPTGADDVDWLQLKKIEGQLANTVYRVDTKGGQPPASVNGNVHIWSLTLVIHYYYYLSSALPVPRCCRSSSPQNTVSVSC